MTTFYYVRLTLADGGVILSRAFKTAQEADKWALAARRCPDVVRVEIVIKEQRHPAA